MGTYIRVSGISRDVDETIVKELELQGVYHSFDEIVCKTEILWQKNWMIFNSL